MGNRPRRGVRTGGLRCPERSRRRTRSRRPFTRLSRIVAAELGTDTGQLRPEQDLFALGATSRQLLRLAARIAADGGRELPLETLFTAADLGDLADQAFPTPVTV